MDALPSPPLPSPPQPARAWTPPPPPPQRTTGAGPLPDLRQGGRAGPEKGPSIGSQAPEKVHRAQPGGRRLGARKREAGRA